jgi:AmmeMemoRadiSam system protein A
MDTSCVGCALFPHPPIMLPEIGKGELSKMKSTVEAVQQASELLLAQKPETIVIMTPHNLVFRDGAAIFPEPVLYGNLGDYGFPELTMDISTDMELSEEILRQSKDILPLHRIDRKWADQYGYALHIDQGAFVPLYYLKKAGFHGQVILMSPYFSHYDQMVELGALIDRAALQLHRRIGIIASGDLSHRLLKESPNGYTPNGAVFDRIVMKSLKLQDMAPLKTMTESFIDEAGMCGLPSVYFLFGFLRHMVPAMPVYSYEGPFGVGYGVALYLNQDSAPAPRPADADIRVLLARQSVSYYLQHHTVMTIPADLPEELTETSAGAFVSLKKHGALRGCIGTFLPMQLNIASEIIHNAVSAATRDPRFRPVTLDELPELDISVDILGSPELATRDQLDPRKYGVIVMSHARTGLLLPDLEGVDTVEQQIEIAKEKAGIPAHVRPDLYRFTVTRYH